MDGYVNAGAIVKSSRAAWWTVALLSLLYVLSFIDRVILALLVTPLKGSLGVSDVQLGLLFGPAFGTFYALLGIPIARLADRGNRRNLILAGVMLWGVSTILSAFAGSFWILVALRIGLALGEAALTPATYSLIGDLFPAHRRSLAASIYSAVGMAGTSTAYLVGAAVIQGADHLASAGVSISLSPWRLVLVVVGAPSLIGGLVFALSVREPPRLSGDGPAPPLSELITDLRARARLFGGLFVAAGLIQATSYAYAAWGPEFLRRTYGWSISQAGYAFGLAGLVAGFGGTLTAPAVTRVVYKQGRKDAVALTSMAALALGIGFAVFAPLQSNPVAFLVLFAFSSFCLNAAANNVGISLQFLVTSRMRATYVALNLTCITLLGLGIGPFATAAISSAIDPSGHGLGPALAILAIGVTIPSMALLAWSRGALQSKT